MTNKAGEQPTITQALKPCPFCGSEKIFADQYVRDGVGISCGDCNTKIYEYHGPPDRPSARERCFTRWNTRTTSLAAQDGLVDALAVHLYERSMSKTLGAAKLVSWSDDTKAFWIERARAALASIEVKS